MQRTGSLRVPRKRCNFNRHPITHLVFTAVLPTVFGAFVRHHLLWMVQGPHALSFELGRIIPDPEESVQSSSAPVVGKRDLTFDIERVFGFEVEEAT